MARLNGAIYSYQLPHSGIGFSIPVERLYHINGTPREEVIPDILVNMEKALQGDVILEAALDTFR